MGKGAGPTVKLLLHSSNGTTNSDENMVRIRITSYPLRPQVCKQKEAFLIKKGGLSPFHRDNT